MKTNFKYLVLIALAPFMLLACSKKHSNGAAASAGATGSSSNVVLQMHYFKGGFFAPPNSPNWSRDLTINFADYDHGYLVTAKDTDPLCFKANARISTSETTYFLDLVSQLQLYVSTGPILADAGVEYIEFTLQDGSKRRYHLLNAEVPAGQYYANNPNAVRTYLQDLDDSLPIACQ